MFQGILLKTDPGLISSVGVWIVFAATMFFENMRKILLFIVALSFLFFAFRSQAAIGGPGVCGTSCMASMNGYYRMPGLFYWPTYPNPWMTSPWTMMGSPYSYYGSCFNCGFYSPNAYPGVFRGIQSVEE